MLTIHKKSSIVADISTLFLPLSNFFWKLVGEIFQERHYTVAQKTSWWVDWMQLTFSLNVGVKQKSV